MAITETRPETGTASDAPESFEAQPVNFLGTGDHKAIGLLYVALALVLGVVGWVVTALWGAHQVGDGNFLSQDASNTLFAGGHLGLILLVVVPLFLGLATYVVPLQIGANTLAFPRAASAAMWTWLLSGGVFIVANSIDGGIGGGRSEAADLGLLALVGLVFAISIGTLCVITTAVTLRTPGLYLDRAPFTTWAFLVGGSVWLLTLPVLVANIALIYVDHRYGLPANFGVPAGQWDQLSWVTSQPQIYAFMIPGLGIIADIVATLAGVRQANRGVMYGAIGAFGVLSVGAWAQKVFYPAAQDELVFAGMALLIILPTLAFVGGIATTVRAGRPTAKSPFALAIVSTLLILLATVTGFLYAITPLELRETPWYSWGQYALVVAAALTAGIAGVMYWAPKMVGREAADGLGKLNVLVLLGGGALAGLPLILLGFSTKFTGLADADDALWVISIIGDALLALGSLLAVLALGSTVKGRSVEADVWGTGQSLEWACPSPPPAGNFGELAPVRSPEPLLDAAEPVEEA